MVNWLSLVCRLLAIVSSEGSVEIIKISGLVSLFRNFMYLSAMENAIVRDFRVTFCHVYVRKTR